MLNDGEENNLSIVMDTIYMAASSTGWYFTYEFSRISVDTLYSHLTGFYSFSVMSTDYGQISFNNFGKVEKMQKIMFS